MMRLYLPILILGTTSLVMAADPETYRGSGYGFFTAGRCQHGYTILGGGGGAEGFLWKGLTLGAEGGYQKFINDVGFGDFFASRSATTSWTASVSTRNSIRS